MALLTLEYVFSEHMVTLLARVRSSDPAPLIVSAGVIVTEVPHRFGDP
jgi:hypothetical protein